MDVVLDISKRRARFRDGFDLFLPETSLAGEKYW